MAFNENFRLGLTLYTLYQPLNVVKNVTSLYTSANNTVFTAEESTEFTNGSSWDMQATLGFAMNFSGFGLGLGIASPSFHLAGDFTNQYTLSTTAPGGSDTYPSQRVIRLTTGDMEINQPVRVNLGLAYEQPKSFTIAADVAMYLGMDQAISYTGKEREDSIVQYGIADSQRRDIDRSYKHSLVVNANLGAEIVIARMHAIRFGGFVDFSPMELPSAANLTLADLMAFKEDRYGGSLGYGLITDVISADYGVQGYYGKGKIVTQKMFAETPTLGTKDFNSYGVMFFLAASLDIEELKRKIYGTIPGGERWRPAY